VTLGGAAAGRADPSSPGTLRVGVCGTGKRAYTVGADASLVLDENHWYMRRHLRKHPEVVFDPDAPMAGTILVRVERYVGLFFVEQYRWLRENFEPVDRVAHGHLLFRVTPAGDRPSVGRVGGQGGVTSGRPARKPDSAHENRS
jgi:hypothetical protein